MIFASLYGGPYLTWTSLSNYFSDLISDYAGVITGIVAISIATFLVRGIVKAVRP